MSCTLLDGRLAVQAWIHKTYHYGSQYGFLQTKRCMTMGSTAFIRRSERWSIHIQSSFTRF